MMILVHLFFYMGMSRNTVIESVLTVSNDKSKTKNDRNCQCIKSIESITMMIV